MFERIKRMMIKEFHQIFRDKRMRPVLFLTPILQLIIFGYAITTDVNCVSLAVYDLDRSYESRELARRFEASGYFEVLRHIERAEEVRDLLDRGKVLSVLQIDRGFSSDIKKGSQAAVQVLFDGTDSNTALVAMSYANAIIARYAKGLGAPHMRPPAAKLDVLARAWYNPALRSRDYNVPGVIAIMIMLICLLLTSMAVVREREIGTMEQLMVTPLKPAEMILGKTIPFALIGFFDMFLVTIVGVFWFSIPIQGSLLLLVLCTAIYLLSVLGIGLFISTVSKTQQQAMMGTFLFFAPAILLSGLMFPIENMPAAVQYGTYLNPLRYFLIIIRGIFLKGNGIGILWPQMLALFALGAAVMTISVLRFKKRLG
ncbi:MAG TPA: ABC transporter permease [Syntrophorhabdaceae bacterium]|nr:ABC transporter permease [Syntrophorhabdaceae bacterium]HQM80476.1 ABC transporter permease [Syntrophorhabdaceae bacterium]